MTDYARVARSKWTTCDHALIIQSIPLIFDSLRSKERQIVSEIYIYIYLLYKTLLAKVLRTVRDGWQTALKLFRGNRFL